MLMGEGVRIYYQNQTGWDESDYNALRRYLSKMIEHARDNVGSFDGRQRLYELKEMDMEALSDETKVLLYCAILSQNPVLLDECENLSLLKNTVPFEHKLVLNPFKRSGAPIYRQYNVLY
jgi:hypothetical protein